MEVTKAYTGIGSREITFEEANTILKIADVLKNQWTLYSGNADGSDTTFQLGAGTNFVSFIPWEGFNKENFDYTIGMYNVLSFDDAAAAVSVRKYHPAAFSLSAGAQKLMARNYKQVMGDPKFNLPTVDFVVCCAKGSHKSVSGGTGQAVRIAIDMGIPVVNIRVKDWQSKLAEITGIKLFNKF